MTQPDAGTTLVPNARYWDTPAVVERQQAEPFLYWYEDELIRRAAHDLRTRAVDVRRLHVVGCGPGREVPKIAAAFPDAQVVASDIAPNMVAACEANLAAWGLQDRVELRCAPAGDLRAEGRPSQLVVVLDNVLTYVTPAADRVATLRALRALLQPRGLLAAVVHHRWGRPLKTGYFLRQRLLRALGAGRGEAGDRVGRFEGMPVRVHYFTRGEVAHALAQTGFGAVDVRSLAQLAPSVGRSYLPMSGDNNLVVLAEAR